MTIPNYTKTNFVNGGAPAISATELNKLGAGVEDNRGFIQSLENDKSEVTTFELTILTTDWSGTSPPYTATKSVAGLNAGELIEIILDLSDISDYETAIETSGDFSWLYKAVVTNNQVVIYSANEINNNLPIIIRRII